MPSINFLYTVSVATICGNKLVAVLQGILLIISYSNEAVKIKLQTFSVVRGYLNSEHLLSS